MPSLPLTLVRNLQTSRAESGGSERHGKPTQFQSIAVATGGFSLKRSSL